MDNKHTPGPWEIGDEHPETGLLRVLSRKDYVCVLLPNPDNEASPEENYGQVKANAALIAAAPDLLRECLRAQGELATALRDGVEHLDRDTLERWYKGVTEAINKTKEA